MSWAFHQVHISKKASLMPRVVIQTAGELLWTKVHTTITKKISTHLLALKATSIWGSILIRPEKQNNIVASHCTGEVGWQVRKLWPLWFCNLSWGQEDSSELQNYVYIAIGFSGPLVKSEPQLFEELICDKPHCSKSVNNVTKKLLQEIH